MRRALVAFCSALLLVTTLCVPALADEPKKTTPTLASGVSISTGQNWALGTDITIGDSFRWQSNIILPAQSAEDVRLHTTLSEGIDLERARASVRVYVRAGTETGFDDVPVTTAAATTDEAPARTGIYMLSDASSVFAQADARSDPWHEVENIELASSGREISILIPNLDSYDSGIAVRGAQVAVVYESQLTAEARPGTAESNTITTTLSYLTRDGMPQTTPRTINTIYTWSLELTRRTASTEGAEQPNAGAKLRIRDAAGRYLTPEGTWTAAEATLTTDAQGKVSAPGIASGTYTVEELAAPEGHERIAGTHSFTVAAAGLNAESPANSSITLDVKAAAPLTATRADASTGTVALALTEQAAPAPTPEEPKPAEPASPIQVLRQVIRRTIRTIKLAQTGDPYSIAAVVGMACIGAALVAGGVRVYQREGKRR